MHTFFFHALQFPSDVERLESEAVETSLALKEKQRAVSSVEVSIERLLTAEQETRGKLMEGEKTSALLQLRG